MCSSSKDFVTSWTLTKCGPKMCPLLEDFVTSQTSTKCGPKMCRLLEDFVTSWTFTKCGTKMCPSSEDFVTSWTSTKSGPKMCTSLEDFVTSWTFTKCGPKMCPLLEDFVTSRTLFSYDPTYAAVREKKQSRSKRRHRPMVSTVWKISITVVKTENSWNIEPETIKMTHITSTTRWKTNDALHKQQSMPNDAALYIDGIGNGFIAFTWTI
jgi:hypothetical protein